MRNVRTVQRYNGAKVQWLSMVGNGTKLTWQEYLRPYWSNNAGIVFIDVPETVPDEYLTVIAVVPDTKLKIQ